MIDAGLILAAMALGAFISGGLARHIAARLGPAGTVILGLGLELAGVAALASFMDPAKSLVYLVAPLLAYGLGLGLASAQLTGTILRDVPVAKSGQGSATQSTVRQVGSALGTAFSGGALAVGLGSSLPDALFSVNLPAATKASAGSNLLQMREQMGAESELVSHLVDGFAQATRSSLWVSATFLGVGLLGSIMVWFAARKSD